MAKNNHRRGKESVGLVKEPTGIAGLDEITGGGLPRGRPTLVCGAAGCGKTLLGMEFLVRGATQYNQPGVFVAFEETAEELTANTRSLGFNVEDLVRENKLCLDHIWVERSEIEETGEYDLEGLFIRLGLAIDGIGAKRVVLDTLETLFSGLSNAAIVRAELRRLFRWLKEKGVTAIITAERGGSSLTRHGLEEYVSDCVLLLDHRVAENTSTRRLRVVKYRGSVHGTNEYPFLIDEAGITVLPVTSLGLNHDVSNERISSGVERLDAMLSGGYYRGSSVLISGTAGTGKSTLAASFARAACQRGQRCLYFAFEESPNQILRNMRSVGIDLEPYLRNDLLRFHASRPTLHGLEMHLTTIHKQILDFQPQAVVLDPVTNFTSVGNNNEIKSMLMRTIDFLKSMHVTGVFTTLTSGAHASVLEQTEMGVSSLMDTWLLLRDIEYNGERNRGMYILKSRGTAHSNQIREFRLTDHGVELVNVYVGPEGVLTGSARLLQEARSKADALLREQEVDRKKRELERRRKLLESQIAALRAEYDSEEEEFQRLASQYEARETQLVSEQEEIAFARRADQGSAEGKSREGRR
jgi:circadian clock protein KaiC